MLRKASLRLGAETAHNAALARLLRTPAPDLAAAAGKLDLILAHQVFELTFGEGALAALGRNLRGFAC